MRFALIGTFYGREENAFPLMHRVFVASTRTPDEAWLMCESQEDADALITALDDLYDMELIDKPKPDGCRIIVHPTPTENGRYTQIPYSRKINMALSLMDSEAVVYLDNGSMPGPDKYRVMAEGLEQNLSWGGVYCTQERTGFNHEVSLASGPVLDGYCVLNYTQVMHRWTVDRWPLDMGLANPDLADATFWRKLSRTLGPIHPVGGKTIHDHHHIPSPAAVGIV